MKNENNDVYKQGCCEVKDNICKIPDTSRDSINVIIIIINIFNIFILYFYLVTENMLINFALYNTK